jgi:type IV secretion system pilin
MNTVPTLILRTAPALALTTALPPMDVHPTLTSLRGLGLGVEQALLAVTYPPGPVVTDLAAVASIGQVLDNIRNWIIGILAGLATVFLTIGGARRVMSGGDPVEVERANAALRSAAFGYGLAVLAPLIVQVLKSIVGA